MSYSSSFCLFLNLSDAVLLCPTPLVLWYLPVALSLSLSRPLMMSSCVKLSGVKQMKTQTQAESPFLEEEEALSDQEEGAAKWARPKKAWGAWRFKRALGVFFQKWPFIFLLFLTFFLLYYYIL